MNQPKKQFTTARLKTSTKIKVERAKLTYKFDTLESTLDFFLLLGLWVYRQSMKGNIDLTPKISNSN